MTYVRHPRPFRGYAPPTADHVPGDVQCRACVSGRSHTERAHDAAVRAARVGEIIRGYVVELPAPEWCVRALFLSRADALRLARELDGVAVKGFKPIDPRMGGVAWLPSATLPTAAHGEWIAAT